MFLSILPQVLVNALITGSIYALATAGLSLSYGIFRVLNFAHGHMMMVGAYAFYYAYQVQDGSLLYASLFCIGVCVVLGGITVKGFVEPFLRYNLFLPFVTTLALSTMLESIVAMTAGVNVKSLGKGMSYESYELGPIYITPIQIIIIATAVVVLSALAFLVHSTSVGRSFRAIAEQPSAAESLGLHSNRISLGAFILGTTLAGLAGVLVGFETNLQPTMGGSYTIKAFAAMILGGLGNIWGTIIGAFLLGFIENFSISVDFWGYSLPAGYKDAFAFVIILLMLLFRPQGLFGTQRRAA